MSAPSAFTRYIVYLIEDGADLDSALIVGPWRKRELAETYAQRIRDRDCGWAAMVMPIRSAAYGRALAR